jgi:hypothetical protein
VVTRNVARQDAGPLVTPPVLLRGNVAVSVLEPRSIDSTFAMIVLPPAAPVNGPIGVAKARADGTGRVVGDGQLGALGTAVVCADAAVADSVAEPEASTACDAALGDAPPPHAANATARPSEVIRCNRTCAPPSPRRVEVEYSV